jgi:uncharacterized protein involved in type VI secretion and phage assembly
MNQAQFFGKYRGKVLENQDPENLGRIQVSVPYIMGDAPLAGWAMPCMPYAGPNAGMFAVPPVEASVWIEFEGGNLNYPIWSGVYWEREQLPEAATGPLIKLLKTPKASFMIDDETGACTLETQTEAGVFKLSMDQDGIKLTGGEQVTITVSANTIELKNNMLTLTLANNAITLKNGQGTITLSAGNIELKNGASTIKLSPATVNINNGALEVM